METCQWERMHRSKYKNSKPKRKKSANKSANKSDNESEGSTPSGAVVDLAQMLADKEKSKHDNMMIWKEADERAEKQMQNGVKVHPVLKAMFGNSSSSQM